MRPLPTPPPPPKTFGRARIVEILRGRFGAVEVLPGEPAPRVDPGFGVRFHKPGDMAYVPSVGDEGVLRYVSTASSGSYELIVDKVASL